MPEFITDELGEVDGYLERQTQETLHNLTLTSEFGLPLSTATNDPTRVFDLSGLLPPGISSSSPLAGAQASVQVNGRGGTNLPPIQGDGVPPAAYKRYRDREGNKLTLAEKQSIAQWMGREAQVRGFPPELPVMAALTETGDKLINLLDGDKDSQGFFQIRPSANGSAAVESPEAQLRWFLYTATRSPLGRDARNNRWSQAVFQSQISAARGQNDEGQLSVWLGRWCQDIERSAYPDRYQQRYVGARKLLYGQ